MKYLKDVAVFMLVLGITCTLVGCNTEQNQTTYEQSSYMRDYFTKARVSAVYHINDDAKSSLFFLAGQDSGRTCRADYPIGSLGDTVQVHVTGSARSQLYCE